MSISLTNRITKLHFLSDTTYPSVKKPFESLGSKGFFCHSVEINSAEVDWFIESGLLGLFLI